MKLKISKYFIGATMIAFLTTFGLFAASPYNLPVQHPVNIAVNQDFSSDFQFEVVAPEKVFLPLPEERKDFKIGLKITNNTNEPKYFSPFNTKPEIFTKDNIPLRRDPEKIKGDEGIYLRDVFKRVPPKGSSTFWIDVSITNSNYIGNTVLFFNNGYVFQNVSPGKFRLYISYSSEWLKQETKSQISERSEITNPWIGEIKTPAKDIVFLK
jgi:hypothetical protein